MRWFCCQLALGFRFLNSAVIHYSVVDFIASFFCLSDYRGMGVTLVCEKYAGLLVVLLVYDIRDFDIYL